MSKKVRPLVDKYSGTYWKSEIVKAQERQKKFVETAEQSIRVYNAQRQVGILDDAERRINTWWYCVNTLLPAYFSSTPRAQTSLRKRAGNLMYELSALVLERDIQYAMDRHFDFSMFGMNAALQLLLTGRCVSWARYEAEFETKAMEIALFMDPETGQYVDDKKQVYDGDTSNIQPGPAGTFLVYTQVDEKEDERGVLDVVQYNDYNCSDARTEDEVEWRSRRAFLSREKATAMFGGDVADRLSYDSFPEAMKRDFRQDTDKFEGKAELYEIWCAETGKVYWLHKNSDKPIIEAAEPTIEFPNFYPCSVLTQGNDPDSVIPVSDYAHVKDQVLEVERLTTRIHAVTQAIRTNGLYDSTLTDKVEELLRGDLKMIPVPNWQTHKGRGGLPAGVEIFDITPYTNALATLQNARQAALAQLYETLKITDLLRGSSDQYKSATANRLENQWSSMGLVVRQNQFAKFISESISNLGCIIASQFDSDVIFDIADADNLLMPYAMAEEPKPEPMPMPGQEGMPPGDMGMPMAPPPPPPPFDPYPVIDQMKAEILGILRDDEKRDFRIEIASDSMVAVDQAAEQAEGSAVIAAAGQYFNEMRSLIEQYPPMLEFSLQLFQNLIRRYKSGKELDGLFQKALAGVAEVAKAKEEAAKMPPPPDPVMQEMQARMQIAQVEAQARIQATQMQSQAESQKTFIQAQDQQVQAQKSQVEMQIALQKARFDEYMGQAELALKQQELQIKASQVSVGLQKVQAFGQNELNKTSVNMENNRITQLIEMQKLELERMRIQLSESEKLMEERRLSQDQQIESARMAMEGMQGVSQQAQAQPQQTPVVVQNIVPKGEPNV